MMVIEGRGYYGGELQHLCLAVEDGVISRIGKTIPAAQRHDFGNMILLPGGIDVHVHFREPGLTHKEDFYSGSESAAAGGITTVLDMPNTVPPSTTRRTLREKRESVSRKANVDYGLYAGATTSGGLRRLEADSHAFKLYMAESFRSPGVPVEEIPQVLGELQASDRVLTVHAEDPSYLTEREETSLQDHRLARPDLAEEAAIRTIANASTRGEVHIAHLSSRLGLVALEGTPFTCEATPMHLLLDSGASIGSLGKINPPLRPSEDREAIWSAFAEGRIDVLASDHAPHTLEEKGHFPSAPPGAPNVETMYPMMFHLARKGSLSLEVLVNAICSRPARRFGLSGKGEFRLGGDADVVVFDPRVVTKVKGDDLHYRCGWTPFEGWEAVFPKATFLRGELIARDGELEQARRGKWVGLEGGGEES